MAIAWPGAIARRRMATAAGIGLLCGIAAWGAGFLWFVQSVGRTTEMPPHADGIVALTGGADRVETGLRLLANGRADKLLLSGVGRGADLAVLAHRAGIDAAPLGARVTLDHGATTTRGNALGTAAWARTNDIHSVIVVTAFYHMPRALLELRRELPDVVLYPQPVHAPVHEGQAGLPLRLMAEEYTKLLAAGIGLTELGPPHGGQG